MTLTHRPMFQALIEAACRRDSTARALQARRKHALPALCTLILLRLGLSKGVVATRVQCQGGGSREHHHGVPRSSGLLGQWAAL